MATTKDAKRIICEQLRDHGLHNRLTARTIDFSDLARTDCIFVKIHDWDPSRIADCLETIAKANGFRVEFAGIS